MDSRRGLAIEAELNGEQKLEIPDNILYPTRPFKQRLRISDLDGIAGADEAALQDGSIGTHPGLIVLRGGL